MEFTFKTNNVRRKNTNLIILVKQEVSEMEAFTLTTTSVGRHMCTQRVSTLALLSQVWKSFRFNYFLGRNLKNLKFNWWLIWLSFGEYLTHSNPKIVSSLDSYQIENHCQEIFYERPVNQLRSFQPSCQYLTGTNFGNIFWV